MLRVLVVDDSAVDRRLIVHILDSDPGLEVVGEATNGLDAVAATLRLKPDVITMDLQMPVLDGFEATSRIMEQCPTPIVIVGANVEHPDDAFRGLDAGALTLVRKPPGPKAPDHGAESLELIRTVKLMAEVKLVSRRRKPNGRSVQGTTPIPSKHSVELVAFAASTGGPAALAQILGRLPGDFSVPMVLVQHIAQGFEKGLAQWLTRVSSFEVRVADHGEELRPGRVLIAPQARHLGVSRHGTVTVTNGEPIDGQIPSATYLLRSVASEYGPKAMAVILTGMGSDGRDGALELRKAGGFVVAQDADSSVVFGMPGEAVAAGAAHRVLPLDEMAGFLARVCSRTA